MKRRLRAVKEVRYGGKQRFPGDEFDADNDIDAKILTATDITNGPFAEYADDQWKGERSTSSRPKMNNAPVMPTPPPQEPPPPAGVMTTDSAGALTGEGERRKYYRRRDLKAEGG